MIPDPFTAERNSVKVYQAINRVQAALSKAGISKDHRNTQQNYSFRGIDDVYNVLSPLLATNGLCILPRMVGRTVTERETAKGGVLFYVTVEAEFDFVCAEDGSKHTVRTFGEAMDSGDKATNKAMSAAYKYAAFQAFAIPTEGDNDADATTHEVKSVRHTPTDEKVHLAPGRETIIRLAGSIAIEKFKKGDEMGAYEEISGITDADEKLFLWQILKGEAALRASIKKQAQALRETEVA